MRSYLAFAAIVLLVCPVCICALAMEYHVNHDGTGDFATIQAAIDAAVRGDVIIVHPGSHQENIQFKGKNIALRSTAPDDPEVVGATCIEGSYDGPVVTFAGTEDETCELAGFTIMEGLAVEGAGIKGCGQLGGEGCLAAISSCVVAGNLLPEEEPGYGSGLASCRGVISDCTISGNYWQATTGGKAASAVWSCGTLMNCHISSNKPFDFARALDYYAPVVKWCDALIGCTIENNEGGVSEVSEITDCIIRGNAGSGVSDSNSSDGSCAMTVTDCVIDGNSTAVVTGEVTDGYSATGGGGVYQCHYARFMNCQITNNMALRYGGGVFACADTEFINCLITGNSARLGGGVAFCDGSRFSFCTIANNRAQEYGGGILENGWGYDLSATNTIISRNTAGIDGGNVEPPDFTAQLSHCCVTSGRGIGEGIIYGDPIFVAGPLGDYYLSSVAAGQHVNSPCIDAGSDTAASLGIGDALTTSTNRAPDTGIADIGYHYPASAATEPNLEVTSSLNSYWFYAEDTLKAGAWLRNNDIEITVDIYAYFQLFGDPERIYIASDGTPTRSLSRLFDGLSLPTGFAAGPQVIFESVVPASATTGDFSYHVFSVVVTAAGSSPFDGVLTSSDTCFLVYRR